MIEAIAYCIHEVFISVYVCLSLWACVKYRPLPRLIDNKCIVFFKLHPLNAHIHVITTVTPIWGITTLYTMLHPNTKKVNNCSVACVHGFSGRVFSSADVRYIYGCYLGCNSSTNNRRCTNHCIYTTTRGYAV